MLKHKLAALISENPKLKFEVDFGLRDELEYQLAKDRAQKEKAQKRRSERATKLSNIDPILKENLKSEPWVPKPALKFCEPVSTEFDSQIDDHQQSVVSECINFLGIYNNTKK